MWYAYYCPNMDKQKIIRFFQQQLPLLEDAGNKENEEDEKNKKNKKNIEHVWNAENAKNAENANGDKNHNYNHDYNRNCIFLLTYDRMRKYEGAWHIEQHLLFPNYIFLENKNNESSDEVLKIWKNFLQQCESWKQEWKQENPKIVSVSKEEEAFLKNLCGEKHHLSMSRGYIKDGKTYVTEGALQGYEKWIRKIDRHKRLAKLELPYESERKEIQVGLEIFEKS